MKELIEELKYAGIHVMPVKHDGTTIRHPHEYASKYETGFTDQEIDTLLNDGYNGLAVFMSPVNKQLRALDFDVKNSGGEPIFEQWKELVNPELFKKLAIERTRSNGYHVYFLTDAIADVHNIAASKTGSELIALRGDRARGITYCYPTKGYEFIQKSLLELETLELDEVMQLINAGYCINKFEGKVITRSGGLKRESRNRYPEPPLKYKAAFEKFDKECKDTFVPDLLESLGWSFNRRSLERPGNSKEYGHFIELYRPGKKEHEKTVRSAAYYYEKKRLSVYTDDQSVLIPSINNSEGLSSWLSPHQVIYYLYGRDWESTYNEIATYATEHSIELPKRVPMIYDVVTKNGSYPKIEINGIIDWAVHAGFMFMKMSADEDSPTQKIRVVNNVIYDVDDTDIAKAYKEEVDINYQDAEANRLLTTFMPRIMPYLNVLPTFNGNILRDTKDSAFIAFNNGILEITKNDTYLHQYGDLDACVFARDIKDMDYVTGTSEGKFTDFIKMVTIDDGHFKFIKSVFGYLMHTYKKKSFAKAIMIIEDVEDQDEAKGRSGKGLLAQFIKWIRNTVEQDGRNYKSDSQFKMQRISPWTQVFYLNDPGTLIMMQQFYNYITDDFLVELKGKKSYSIPFSKSPKILITTNFLPALESDSDKDRFIVLPIKKVFSSTYRFQDAFPNQEFFSQEWGKFEKISAVNFSVECLQEYFNNGVYEYKNDQIESNKKKRLLKEKVISGIMQLLDLAFDTAKNVENYSQFIAELEADDKMKNTEISLTNCFEFEPGKLKIFTQILYKYFDATNKNNKKNDSEVGKSIKFYLNANEYKYTDKKVRSGRYFDVEILKNVPTSPSTSTWEHANNGFKPIETNDNPF